jgi:crossover junction endodeoxyribonuclease RusA
MTFTIPGRCPTKGSTKSFLSPKTGRIVTLADNSSLKQWTKDARWRARAAQVPMIYKPHGVKLTILVECVKPKTAKQTAPTVRPDLDKSLRACFDMLTGVCYADDSQVVAVACAKVYGPSEQVTITVDAA